MNRSHTLITVVIVWTAALIIGVWVAHSYGADQPEELLHVPATWPAGIDLQRDPDRLTLLLVVHHECDCTRRALAQLRDIASRSVNRLAIRILFTDVRVGADELHKSDTWFDAHEIADADVSVDQDGHAVRAFGFRKSGHAVLYDRKGLLLFNGGITPADAGETPATGAGAGTSNPGAYAILLFTLAGGSPTTHAPVPGCLLTATAN